MPRRGRFAMRRSEVASCGFTSTLQVRGRVADLRALVEARPADDLVRNVLADEHVLQHPRLRVHPVEDRDLAGRVAAADQARRSRPRRSALRRARPRPRSRVPGRPRRGPRRGASACARCSARSASWRPGGSCSWSGSSARARSTRVRRKVPLELHDVANVRASKRVDRVVGDEAVRDEVVRTLDVEVEDRSLQVDPLDSLDDVELSEIVDHHHPRANRRRRHEREGVAILAGRALLRREPCGEAHRDVEHRLRCLPPSRRVRRSPRTTTRSATRSSPRRPDAPTSRLVRGRACPRRRARRARCGVEAASAGRQQHSETVKRRRTRRAVGGCRRAEVRMIEAQSLVVQQQRVLESRCRARERADRESSWLPTTPRVSSCPRPGRATNGSVGSP